MATKMQITMRYQGPKSICTCKHAGDGTGRADSGAPVVSTHAGVLGHGACVVKGCRCLKFTWASHVDAYERALAGASDAA